MDYICTNIGRESVVIVRQHGADLKPFNVCITQERLADEGLQDPFVLDITVGNMTPTARRIFPIWNISTG